MRITYIKHSAFLVDWEDTLCLFDWAEGDLPYLDKGKRLFVFVSHAHSDHYDPAIFSKFSVRIVLPGSIQSYKLVVQAFKFQIGSI